MVEDGADLLFLGMQLGQRQAVLFDLLLQLGIQLCELIATLGHLAGDHGMPSGTAQRGESREKGGEQSEAEEQALLGRRARCPERKAGLHLQTPGPSADMQVALPVGRSVAVQQVNERVVGRARSDVRDAQGELAFGGLGEQWGEELLHIDGPNHITADILLMAAIGEGPHRNEEQGGMAIGPRQADQVGGHGLAPPAGNRHGLTAQFFKTVVESQYRAAGGQRLAEQDREVLGAFAGSLHAQVAVQFGNAIAREAFADDGGLERCALAMSDPRRPVHRVDGRAVDEALGVGVKLRAGDLLTGGEEVRQPLQWQQGFGYFQRGAVADHFHQGACLALCAQHFQSG
ncbi:hypothetical protein D3C78_667360 [compost metagenome]